MKNVKSNVSISLNNWGRCTQTSSKSTLIFQTGDEGWSIVANLSEAELLKAQQFMNGQRDLCLSTWRTNIILAVKDSTFSNTPIEIGFNTYEGYWMYAELENSEDIWELLEVLMNTAIEHETEEEVY
jgi:hypothetical protein